MRTSTAVPLRLNRVLLTDFTFWQFYQSRKTEYNEDERGHSDDITQFEFIVEALVANSASAIAFQSEGKRSDNELLNSVPRTLRKRIEFIGADGGMEKLAKAVFSPVFEEYHIVEVGENYIIREEGQDRGFRFAIFDSFQMLHSLLLGLKYKLEVGMEIEQCRKTVSIIRQESKNSESRANMSVLEGILGLYELDEIEGLRVEPQAIKEQKESFIRFLEDLDYEELSKASFGLGLPLHFKKHSKRISQLVRRVVSNDKFPHVFEACSKSLMVATRAPVPSSDLVKAMVPSSYIPPIVNLKPALHQAYKAWKRSVRDETLVERRKLCEDTFGLR